MAEAVAVDLALTAVKAVIGQLVRELQRVVFCKSEAQKLESVLKSCIAYGGLADMLLLLSPRSQTLFEEDFWGFLHVVEDSRVVVNSTQRLQWYQLPQRYNHSKQLQSLRHRLAEYTKLDFLFRLQAAAARDREQTRAQMGGRMNEDRPAGWQGIDAPIGQVFQHTEKLIPKLKSQLAGANGKRNLGLCGMPGLGKTTIARRMFEELRVGPGFDAAIFMPVSKVPNCRQLLNKACEELLGITEFPYETAEDGRDFLMGELSVRGMRVLLVLDDVWSAKDLAVLNFATGPARASPGPTAPLLRHDESRLLVTTRDRRVLTDIAQQGSTAVEEPPLLQPPYDLQLLSYHAFGNHEEVLTEEWQDVVQEVLHECKGNPLALSVIGAGLKRKELEEWRGRVSQLKAIDQSLISTDLLIERCRTSFEELDLLTRDCFKLLAGFPEDHRFPVWQLLMAWTAIAPATVRPEGAQAWARGQLLELLDRSLIMRDIDNEDSLPEMPDNRYYMHDILRDLAFVESRKTGKELFVQPGQILEHCFLATDQTVGCLSGRASTAKRTVLRKLSILSGESGWPQHLQAPTLGYLDLSHSPIKELPKCRLSHLRFLAMDDMVEIPDRVTELAELQALCLSNSSLAVVPDNISVLSNLRGMYLPSSILTALPVAILCLTTLRELYLPNCDQLASLPESISAISWLQELDLGGCKSLASLPETVAALTNLQKLDLYQCEKLEYLPEALSALTRLESLNLRECTELSALPDGISALTSLQWLDLDGCTNLAALPDGISELCGIRWLGLRGCERFTSLPTGISALTRLLNLGLSECGSLESLPEGISALKGLRDLSLAECKSLESLPEALSSLTGLRVIDLADCGNLESLPQGLSALNKLQVLDLAGCEGLAALPEGLTSLTSLRYLDISYCGCLQSLPEGISGLTNLTWLTLRGCIQLARLPNGISALTSLQDITLDCSRCWLLQSLPEGISALRNLRGIDLSECESLGSLPEGVSDLVGLRQLDLSGCASLRCLPAGISALTNLTKLDLSGCGSLAALPEGVATMTGLQKLVVPSTFSTTSLEGILSLAGLQMA